ncbi:hypothetical protein GOP47_0013703 [Adiantum capillus-veneris]|uniref:Uncharacterized protein n=1 Tax=Adiantum capillus-veneris TaxID=13818 RepID=A0A9D4ZET3_ADICA|nr:hypothetical protein GOP47_0013703 [Adiantum capillus-veneris]
MGHEALEVQELRELADFERIANADGLISIGGFGSLLSERSARYTFPDLKDFRVARLNGFRRIFGHTAPIFFERGIANLETKEISSLSVEPCFGESILITVFEIRLTEIPDFMEREHEFRYLMVSPEYLDKTLASQPAVVCAHSSDEEYFDHRLKGSKDEFFKRFGRHGIDRVWRDDIFPCRLYLRHCRGCTYVVGDNEDCCVAVVEEQVWLDLREKTRSASALQATCTPSWICCLLCA